MRHKLSNKILLTSCGAMCTLLSSARDYTGYGRGLDCGGHGGVDFSDCSFLIFIILIVIIGGITMLVTKTDKPSHTPSPIKPKTTITEKDYKIFKKCWLYTDFIKQYGKINAIKEYTNSNTGKKFKSCIIRIDNRSIIYLTFATSLDELSLNEIYRRREELKVGLSYMGNYKLYDDNIKVIELEDVDINLIIENSPEETALKNPPTHIVKSPSIEEIKEAGAWDIKVLSIEERYALFKLIALIGSYKAIEQSKDKAKEIVNDFANTIKLSEEDRKEALSQVSPFHRHDYIEVIKGIELNYPIYVLFEAWRKLVILDPHEDGTVAGRLKWACKEIGFTYDEYLKIKDGEFIKKY